MRARLRGNWATLLLPIADDDSIAFGSLKAEIDVLIDAQVDGIYSNGTAGEFHNQTEAEYDRVQATLAAACASAGMPFVIGACHSDPMVTRQRVARAAALKPRAIQIILPDWWPLTDGEAVDFLDLAAHAADGVPLVLYNPPHAKRVLTPPELQWVLARAPTVEAVKLGDGDAAWYAAARAHLAGISLFVPGHHLATGMREGVAAGAFSNVACLNPRGAQRWTDLMATDIAACLDVEARLQAFIDTHIWPFRRDHGYSNAALDKLLAAIGDWAPVGTRLRRPYRFIDAGEARRLGPIAREAVPELFI
ncbi:dihydrodipicolinate synthase family protein [Chelatococcus asaccharovorans]|uniref:Dihydrodipicolinate synthase/N-acetylneuraminate lyase n=1 Tax=Chelatococcus asaccharovorans TaxID=28210 RepID=A0A2V3U4L8_9HYPH|nr:dihydrodipicolinate synthase family protein [Chelatococcus asaccharovorans]MBS7702902.1 dihydrodipicolinate synthase family protein [Chelatococcus asaccharovorans]PXW57202.1 dihydrodipicolinate synthase/N-acetylneuraminate lyase [Chelatococcus asaccharovorans]